MRKLACGIDRFEGLAEVVGDGVGGGSSVRAGLDLDGAVAADCQSTAEQRTRPVRRARLSLFSSALDPEASSYNGYGLDAEGPTAGLSHVTPAPTGDKPGFGTTPTHSLFTARRPANQSH